MLRRAGFSGLVDRFRVGKMQFGILEAARVRPLATGIRAVQATYQGMVDVLGKFLSSFVWKALETVSWWGWSGVK